MLVVASLLVSICGALPVELATPARAQVRPVYSNGAAGLGALLRRLQTTASALHTGAHPDDEDSALISTLVRGESARVAYLSLNRGEGGQNIIGNELFEPLGVIRTEELLQARRLDGGEQLFTRVFDYGFTKTRAEAAAKWGEQLVLGDMVRAIRLYRPHVVISRFSGTPADGHGHHQLAGYLTPLAFRAAADPNQFPEQLREGLRVWQAKKLYVGQGFRQDSTNQPSLFVETGRLDPLLGRSYFEVAMEGRSQHKSQEMGLIEVRGEQRSGVRLLENLTGQSATGQQNAAPERSVFDGIDTSLRGIKRTTGLKTDAINDELSDAEKSARAALAGFDPFAPQKIIQPLAEGLRAVRRARANLSKQTATEDQAARADADFLLAQKEQEFSEALRRAAGITIDALADMETVAPGESFNVKINYFAPGSPTAADNSSAPATVDVMSLRAPQGWEVAQMPAPTTAEQPFRSREVARQTLSFRVTVPSNANVTEPYWLHQPRNGDTFRWLDTDASRSLPFDAPTLVGEVTIKIGGEQVTINQPVQYRYADDIRGELRRDVNVVPALSVGIEPNLIIVPTGTSLRRTMRSKQPVRQALRRVAVRVVNNSQKAVSGQVRLRLPAGWSAQPESAPFTINKKDDHAAAVFNLSAPSNAAEDAYKIGAVATLDNQTAGAATSGAPSTNGQTFDREMRTVAYPHIQTHRYYTKAESTVRVLDMKVAPVKVGYIMGSGDQVPQAIEAMGLNVQMLDADTLTTGDLSQFDVIVVGVRASQVRTDFVQNNNRLLDYVRAGGTMIVQYQRPDYVEANLTPFPAKMASRTTDENASVQILQPAHPAFNFPNNITDKDFAGWVQERSLYNFTTFDPRYTALLESHDAGEKEQTGGEVYAELGRGKYIYTSYAWFRQLPSGVPGAYRQFANLLSLSKAPRSNGG